jgi:hypothetical protein
LFHAGGGADVVRPVQNWRAADHENDGKGTLIHYDLGKIWAARWKAGQCTLRRDAGRGLHSFTCQLNLSRV